MIFYYAHDTRRMSDGTTPEVVANHGQLREEDMAADWHPASQEEVEAYARYWDKRTAPEGAEPLKRFEVEVSRSISTTVTVFTPNAEAALDMVEFAGFPLPAQETWSAHKDWSYRVYDEDGEEVGERER